MGKVHTKLHDGSKMGLADSTMWGKGGTRRSKDVEIGIEIEIVCTNNLRCQSSGLITRFGPICGKKGVQIDLDVVYFGIILASPQSHRFNTPAGRTALAACRKVSRKSRVGQPPQDLCPGLQVESSQL